ncbi:hypothetical protein BDW_05930 [Bdellovibrio bacteriovorus W]|nr:hypothetical protein BDW_05930 [Bdellovibrio bacteriovorus W]
MIADGVSLENNQKVMPKFVLWFWRFSWVMFGLSFFTSKSGLSIFSTLLILVSLFYVNWRAFFKEKWLVLFAATVPLGMFLNLFSLGGWESSLKFLGANPWPLLVIPGFYLTQQKRELAFFLWPLSVSLILALLKAGTVFYVDYGLVFNSKTRVYSYFDIGRWGQFLSIATVSLFGLSYPSAQKNRWLMLYYRSLFVLSLLFLVFSNTRAPWVGFFVGMILIIILMKKYLKTIIAVMFICSVVVLSNKEISARVVSIFEVKRDETGVITSEDTSNAGRLHMWKVALDRFPENPFFGTGFKNSETSLIDFLSKQTDNYRNTYTGINFSYNDAHSSYFQSLNEMGLIFFIYYWGILAFYFIFMIRKFLKDRNSNFLISAAVVSANMIVYIFYSSYSSYEVALLSFGMIVGSGTAISPSLHRNGEILSN